MSEGRDRGKPETRESFLRCKVVFLVGPLARHGLGQLEPGIQAMEAMPCLAASVSNFAAGPRGRFSRRSHLLTTPVVTFR